MIVATKAYEEIRDDLRTGDVVLFDGRGLVSNFISAFCAVFRIKMIWRKDRPLRWSHVGMVYRPDPNGPIMITESTTLSKLRDILTGRRVAGVQTVLLSDRIKSFGGTIGIRRLSTDRPIDGAIIERERLSHAGRQYQRGFLRLAAAGTPWSWRRKAETNSVFCSEWVEHLLKATELYSSTLSPEELAPVDFATETINRYLSDAQYAEVITILKERRHAPEH